MGPWSHQLPPEPKPSPGARSAHGILRLSRDRSAKFLNRGSVFLLNGHEHLSFVAGARLLYAFIPVRATMRRTLFEPAHTAEANGRVLTDFYPAKTWLLFPLMVLLAGSMLPTRCWSVAPDAEGLTNTVQVRSLTMSEAQAQAPVIIHGAVTYYDGVANILFVQDPTGGIRVRSDRLAAPGLRQGKFVQVRGRTGVEGKAAVIVAESLVVLSNAVAFSSKHISLAQMATGQENSQWVSITGVVQAISIARQQRRLTMEISDGQETILAHIPGFSASNAAPVHLIHAQARLRGVAQARLGTPTAGIFIGKRPWVGDQLFVPSLKEVMVVQHAPLNVATRLIRPINSLLELQRDDEAVHVVKIAGTVTLTSETQYVYIQDHTAGLMVELVGQPQVRPGQRIEVIGFPELSGRSPCLSQGQITHVSEAAPVSPLKTTVRETVQGRWDGQLVKLEADVIASLPRSTPPHFLLLQRDGIIFETK